MRQERAHTTRAGCLVTPRSPLCAVATSNSQYLLCYAEWNLLRLNPVFAVCDREHSGVISCGQLPCPLHMHGIFLSGKKTFFFALSFCHKLAAGIQHSDARYREHMRIAGV